MQFLTVSSKASKANLNHGSYITSGLRIDTSQRVSPTGVKCV